MSQPITAEQFVAASQYAQEVLRRWRLQSDWLERGEPKPGHGPVDDLPIEAALRRRRQLESLRILWHEQLGRHDVDQTGRALSRLASECLSEALIEAESRVTDRHGRLQGADSRLCALALGKLGGDELNFNSDIDLVFVHDGRGQSDGRRPLPARDYFSRVVRELTRLMDEITAHGRVWIVDTRLRPFGQAGALVWSLDAMEHYFVNEGRTWERYAWLKARPVAGDLKLGRELLKRISPFVFRRYLDYGLLDSLRTLHAEIDERSRREDLRHDIKRGPGGIRELEFLVQSLQLLRGGREPDLRQAGFLPALEAAATLKLIEPGEARQIAHAYRFLRVLENRLQLATGRQTQELPDDPEVRDHLSTLMGYSSWQALDEHTARIRASVRGVFEKRFETPPIRTSATRCLWPPTEALEQQLANFGFDASADAASGIRRLFERVSRRAMSAEGRRRLDRLMPELFDELIEQRSPDIALPALLALIETIARRSAYLALLHERPQTLSRTVRVFKRSDRVAEWVIASPQLLDDLLGPVGDVALPTPPRMQRDEIEASLNALARYRQAGFVRTALGQLDGKLDRPAARRHLTRLAETVLESMSQLLLPDNQPHPAIIGYGNLGAAELHYTSDLDLVFLSASDEPPLRAVQRLINSMQIPMAGGKLYAIDTRLRPNGNAGMLVSTLDSFADYQRRHAWTWEHQALVRARCIFGSDTEKQRFEEIRRDALCQPREVGKVVAALRDMRGKQLAQRKEGAHKRVLGDIQFVAELGVLLHAAEAPQLISIRDTTGQIEQLAAGGWLDVAAASELVDIHKTTASLRDRVFLERNFDESMQPEIAQVVARVWQQVFGEPAGGS
ncbi:MAG: bifunctional [glutamate--ammonia ligase]-adenylyl-L-tyrosine phosphorylase/[glutamate--ammonia-ligase] adenylyltransferase [Wenzhouxiangellaceae bacterium]